MNVRNRLAIPAEVVDTVKDPKHRWIAVCRGTGCASSASAEVRQALCEELDSRNLNEQVEVRRTGCFGFCEEGPIVVVHPEETFYTRVRPSDVEVIVEEHIVGGQPVERLL